MVKVVYPGSFDPITNGHLDIIIRASKIFDEVIVAILTNPDKNGLFSIDERVNLIQKVTNSLQNVKVDSFSGLLINYMKKIHTNVIIKGLRSVPDFELEFQMALMNNKLAPDIETIFMVTNTEYSYVSSSAVKQVASFGGSLKGLVPEIIIQDINKKIKTK